MKDERLLNIINNDTELGLQLLIQKYSGIVYSVIKSKLYTDSFCDADIEECVADTFVDFYRGLDAYSPEKGSIKSLLCVIAKNNATDYLRKVSRRVDTLSIDSEKLLDIEDTYSLEGDFENKTEKERLIKAIRKLGKPDSEIIVRKFYLSQSSAEIAKILNISVSNVDTRTYRALRKLKKIFGGEHNEEFK